MDNVVDITNEGIVIDATNRPDFDTGNTKYEIVNLASQAVTIKATSPNHPTYLFCRYSRKWKVQH